MSRKVVTGCYSADAAPSLLIEPGAIKIAGPEHATLSYEVGWIKDGYVLMARPAWALHRKSPGRYGFVPTGGQGFFWELLPATTTAHLQEPSAFGGRIGVLAADGTTVIYRRHSSPRDCAN